MVGVPKKAQKGPVKHKDIIFLFTARPKMLGFLKNLKWKFSFHVNSFLQNLEGWSLIDKFLFTKYSKNRPFMASLFGAFLGAPL